MESSLPDLLAAVSEGRVLTPEVFADIDCDEVMVSREEDVSFDDDWNRCYSAIEKAWSDREVMPEVEEMVDEIREQALEVAGLATDQHELASVISEDFDLFARAIVLEHTDPFLDSLWESYENGEIPSPATMSDS